MASFTPNILQYDITAYRGDTLTVPVSWKDSTGVFIDLSGSTGLGQIKLAKTDALAVDEFTVTLGNAEGNLTISLSAEQTAGLGTGSWVYDIQVTTGAVVRTYISGKLKIIQDVTRV